MSDCPVCNGSRFLDEIGAPCSEVNKHATPCDICNGTGEVDRDDDGLPYLAEDDHRPLNFNPPRTNTGD
jgi:hypothetical protein